MTKYKLMRKPNISTAIPRQRYKFGAYTIIVLGEIESNDQTKYEYLLAAVKDGHSDPEAYITSERVPPAEADNGSHVVRVFAKQLDQQQAGKIIDQSDSWAHLETFISYALSGFRHMLQLQGEQPVPLS